MVTMRSIAAAAAAVALTFSVPVSAANAASRPGSAVPAATVGTAGAQSARLNAGNAFAPWPAYFAIGLAVAFGVWIATRDDDKGGLPIQVSRG